MLKMEWSRAKKRGSISRLVHMNAPHLPSAVLLQARLDNMIKASAAESENIGSYSSISDAAIVSFWKCLDTRNCPRYAAGFCRTPGHSPEKSTQVPWKVPCGSMFSKECSEFRHSERQRPGATGC